MDIFNQVGGLDVVCPVRYMADFGGFRAGLEFVFPDLGFFVEGHEVFLKISSEVVDILFGAIEN